MQIIFFRHGIAADRQAGQTDDQRPLTDEGITKTTRIAAGLAKLIGADAAILTSPKLRAHQTANLLGEAIGAEPRVVDKLGIGSSKAVIEVAGKFANDKFPTILVGHEPDLGEATEMMIAGRLIGRIAMKKAGAACIAVTGPIRWGQSSGNLQWLSVPGMWNE